MRSQVASPCMCVINRPIKACASSLFAVDLLNCTLSYFLFNRPFALVPVIGVSVLRSGDEVHVTRKVLRTDRNRLGPASGHARLACAQILLSRYECVCMCDSFLRINQSNQICVGIFMHTPLQV